MDFLEIMEICAYDLEAASEMMDCCSPDVVEEVLTEIGLEKISAEPDRA